MRLVAAAGLRLQQHVVGQHRHLAVRPRVLHVHRRERPVRVPRRPALAGVHAAGEVLVAEAERRDLAQRCRAARLVGDAELQRVRPLRGQRRQRVGGAPAPSAASASVISSAALLDRKRRARLCARCSRRGRRRRHRRCSSPSAPSPEHASRRSTCCRRRPGRSRCSRCRRPCRALDGRERLRDAVVVVDLEAELGRASALAGARQRSRGRLLLVLLLRRRAVAVESDGHGGPPLGVFVDVEFSASESVLSAALNSPCAADAVARGSARRPRSPSS